MGPQKSLQTHTLSDKVKSVWVLLVYFKAASPCCVAVQHVSPAPTYLCSLCLLVQQRQPRQVFQEGVGRIENLGQEVEAFSLIVVQDLNI